MVANVLSTPALSLAITTCTCSREPSDSLVLGARSWKVTPEIALATVFEALVVLTPSTQRVASAPFTDEVYPIADVVVSTRLELTARVPADPEVPEVSDRVAVPSLLVTAAAVTPTPAAVMAPAMPESVLRPLPV